MGVWDLIRSTAEAVKRKTPDATPVMNACKNSYNYSAAAFTKVNEAVPSPVKNACRITYTYGSAAFSKVDRAVRINGLYKLSQWMPDNETKSEICTYTPKSAMDAGLCTLEERHQLIAATIIKIDQVIVMPVKNTCRAFYTYVSAAFTKIDQIVRINGLYRLAKWMEEDETKSRVGEYATTFAEIAWRCSLQELVKFIPGGVAFFTIASNTLSDVNYESIKAKEVKLWEEEAGSPHKDLTSGREIIVQEEVDGEEGVEYARRSSYTYGSTACTKNNRALDWLAQLMPDDETKSKIGVYTATFAKYAGLYAFQQSYKFIPGRGAFSRVFSRTLNEFARKKAKKH